MPTIWDSPFLSPNNQCYDFAELTRPMKGFEFSRVTAILSNTKCVTIFAFTCLAMALLGLISNGYKNQLPFLSNVSAWPYWTLPSSSLISQPIPNNERALYPTFDNPKMQKALENLVTLNEETMSRRGKERDRNMEKIEAGLTKARWQIKNAIVESRTSPPLLENDEYFLQEGIYKNAYVFQRSYKLMERMFKIYVYEEGEPPLFHNGPFKNIYSIEGIFLNNIETKTDLRTNNPDEAHVYFLPFSVVMILENLYDPVIRDKAVLGSVVGDYVHVISSKYSYWNRSLGADHFMLSCHDWGPRTTWYVHQLYFTSMRVLCNANTSEFFNPRKDVSIPEINLPTGDLTGLTLSSRSSSSSNRTILSFFAGQLHGHIRPLLFQHWKEKDDDIKIFEKVPDDSPLSYQEMMENSKFCLCPSGHEVASPRIVEAIYAECVPVLISQDYVLPFSDVLDWEKFSVRVSVGELPDLKNILVGIADDKYELLRKGVKIVQKHFMVNDPPKRYDVFHMMLHSLWLRRLNLRINA